MEKLCIGWSEKSITPTKKVRLAGQFFERVSESVETPVTVTAMAVDAGDGQMVICSCDLISISENLLRLVRERLAGTPGLLLDKIILNATHTHTSLEYDQEGSMGLSGLDILKRYLSDEQTYVDKTAGEEVMEAGETMEFLVSRISEAVSEAWVSRKPAQYANGFGRAAVGMCRRAVYDDGTAKMWGDTALANFQELEGGNDSGIELLYVFDAEKKLTGIVANVACPSQVVEHRSYISSDYWGKVKILLRKHFGEGLFVLGLCSAAGDLAPRDIIRWVEPESPIDDPNIRRESPAARIADPSMFDVKGTWTVGRRIASEIIAVYEELGALRKDAELVHEVIPLHLPIRRVTITEYQDALHILHNYLERAGGRSFSFEDQAAMHVYAGTVARYENQQKQNLHKIELHVIRFGDIAICTNPFELFLDYGNQIRARSKAKQTILIQLACGSNAYLPTEKAEHGGHYSAYVSSGIIGHEGGSLLVQTTVETINSLWE